jgi:hypothetical protein
MYGTVILPVPVPYRYDTVPYGIILYSTVFYSTVPVPLLSNTVTRNSSMVPVLYGTVRYGTTGPDRTAKFVYKVGNNHAMMRKTIITVNLEILERRKPAPI